MKNEIQQAPTGIGGLKNLLESPTVKKRLADILGKRASVFTTSVIQIAQSNDLLATAEPSSIVGAAMTAATLGLPLNNSIGQAYIVPYNVKQKDGSKKTMAQFQIGWKGWLQLAYRTNQFARINATDVRQGEIAFFDRLSGDIDFQWEQDSDKRLKLPIIGYVAYFRLINSQQASLFMTTAEITAHAKKYSQSFRGGFGVWKDDFESMALKTVLKLLISKKAPVSIENYEMQRAIETDQATVINNETEEETYDVDYVDNEPIVVDPELERIREYIENIQTQAEADLIRKQVPTELDDLFMEKLIEKGLK